MDFGSSFVLVQLVCKCKLHIQKPVNASQKVFSCSRFFWSHLIQRLMRHDQALRYVVVLTISTQNLIFKTRCFCNIHWIASMIVLFTHLATPFCYDMYIVEVWCEIPWALKKSWPQVNNLFFPLLILNTFNFFQVCTSTKFLNSQFFLKHSFLLHKKLTRIFLDKSLMKVMKYLAPLKDGTLASPQMAEWTSPSTYVAQGIPSTCQMVKPSQNFIFDLIALGSPSMSLCWTMSFMFLLLKWVYFWCQRSRLLNPTSRPSCVVFVVDQVLKFNL